MKITLNQRKNHEYYDRLYRKLVTIQGHIHDRTTNNKNQEWDSYGGRGVQLDPKWTTYSGFIEDVDSIEGWNEHEFMNGNLELDKDIKIPGNKLYSKNTTKWVTHKENMQVLPGVQTLFYAYNQYTGVLEKGNNRGDFSNRHGLNIGLNGVLHGRKHRVGDWWLWLASEEPPKVYRYFYKDRVSGEVTWDINPQRLSLALGRNRAYISARMSDGRHKDHIWSEKIDLASLINNL